MWAAIKKSNPRRYKHIVLVIYVLSAQWSWAQDFELMRFDEDYSEWKDSAATFYNRIKYIPFTDGGNTYLSLGGEVRGEFNHAVNEDWGETGVGRDVFLLQRYHVHADVHFGNRVRFFGQLRSGLEDGRKHGPRGVDEDRLNVQNLFVDVVPYEKPARSLTLRVGRQELRYGSGRLIDVRDGPNLRLYVDGVKVSYTSPRLKVDAFVMADAIVNTGVFDNASTRKANLWGIYNTYILPDGSQVDGYYLGINRVDAVFDEGVGNETRHMLGARVSRNSDGFAYNFETGYQFGKFGLANIGAWAVSSEIGYTFDYTKGAPTLKLRSDYISGDKAVGDGKLGTFNAMYPKGGYFGMNPQVGPANLIAVHPNLAWNPHEDVELTMEVVFNWRSSTEDGIYGPSGAFSISAANLDDSYIGTAYVTTMSWYINGFLSYNMGVQYFKTGRFINSVIPRHKDGFFVGLALEFKF